MSLDVEMFFPEMMRRVLGWWEVLWDGELYAGRVRCAQEE